MWQCFLTFKCSGELCIHILMQGKVADLLNQLMFRTFQCFRPKFMPVEPYDAIAEPFTAISSTLK